MVVDDSTRARLSELRRRVRLADGRPNDGRCGNVAAAVEREFGWPRECGYLRLNDGSVSWVHCWNRLSDGSVLDATADQFGAAWPGDLLVVGSDIAARHYLPEPRHWDLAVTGTPDHQVAVVITRGDDIRTVPFPEEVGGWRDAARVALRLVTGWDLLEDDVDLAARALRAMASSAGVASTADLIRPLVTAFIRRQARAEETPWIAEEFADPLSG